MPDKTGPDKTGPERLRRVAPLSKRALHGVVPQPTPGPPPEIRWVDPGDLLIDEAYQRNLTERSRLLITRIVERWDWGSFKLPNVRATKAGLVVEDGQHTAIAAASHPGIATIPVALMHGGGLAEQARVFLNVNTNRLNVTPGQVHYAALAAGDAVAQHIQRLADAGGIRILKSPVPVYRAGDTLALGTLAALYNNRGPARLRVMLDLLKTRAPVMALELKALDVLMSDPDYRGQWDLDAARAILVASSGYERREAEAIAATHARPHYVALAMVWFRRMPRKSVVGEPALVRRQA